MDDRRFDIEPIGYVRSPLTSIGEAPNQGDEGAPNASIVLRADLHPALQGLAAGDEVIVVTWLDRADRAVLAVHPRSDPTRPRQGVFTTRSPDRPNPIGLHAVVVLAIDGTRLLVGPLEAVDGTPVIDIKPILGPVADR